jgi:hypothetical protein
MADAPAVVGKVTAYEAGRSITLETVTRAGATAHEFTIVPDQTRIELPPRNREITVGSTLAVWADKDDSRIAARVAPPPGRPAGRANRRPQRPANVPQQPAPRNTASVSSTPARPAERRESGLSPGDAALRIDREIRLSLETANLEAGPVCGDAEFVRRASLDLIGVIPPADKAAEFVDSNDPDKRTQLIDAFLADTRYGEYFGELWSDRIVPHDLPLDPGPLRQWLADHLNAGAGWNDIVSALVTAEGSFSPIGLRRAGSAHDPPATFLLANSEENQPRPDRLAGATSALFLGVQVQCAECHDHPFANWKQTDFWGLAAFYGQLGAGREGEQSRDWQWFETAPVAGQPLSIVIPSTALRAVGDAVPASFLDGQPFTAHSGDPSGTGDDGLRVKQLRQSLAEWITSPENPYFARAAVNRLWAHFFGRGLVNPVDDLRDDNPPSHPAILQLLADEFTKSGFDVKYLIRCICLSETYQRSSQSPMEADHDSYARMAVKVMGPGVLYDSLTAATGLRELQVGLSRSTSKQGVTSPLSPRAAFVAFFRTQDEDARAADYNHGIPQALKLLNARQLSDTFPAAQQLIRSGLDGGRMIEQLYLTALARRPTADEAQIVREFLASRGDGQAEEDYSAVLWALINSSEFVLIQ